MGLFICLTLILATSLALYFSGFFLMWLIVYIVKKNSETNLFCEKMWEEWDFSCLSESLAMLVFSWVAVIIAIVDSFKKLYECFDESLIFYKFRVPYKPSNKQRKTIKVINDYIEASDNPILKNSVKVVPYKNYEFILLINNKPDSEWDNSLTLLECIRSGEFVNLVNEALNKK